MRLLDTYPRLVRRRIHWSGGRSTLREAGGRRLHVYEIEGRGDGPDAVLLHGLGGTANTFAPVLDGLRAGFRRLWVPDLPGHGFSELGPGEDPLDVQGHFEVFAAFVRDVVRAPAVLVGNSLGGALVLRTAIERSQQVVGIGLLAPAGAPLGDEGLASIRTGFGSRTQEETLALMGRMLHRVPPGAWLIAAELREMFLKPPVQRVLEAARPDDALLPEELAALPMPITFVWGESERLLPATGWDYYRTHLPPHARIVKLPRAGHLPMLEQPRRTTELLVALGQEAKAFASRRPGA